MCAIQLRSSVLLVPVPQRGPILSGPVLRDTARLSRRYPPIARYGVLGVSTWQIGCDTPSPFSERLPLGEHAKWRCDTPPSKGYISAILARYPMKTRQMGAIPTSAILISKGYCAIWGGISHWAAKAPSQRLLRFIQVVVAHVAIFSRMSVARGFSSACVCNRKSSPSMMGYMHSDEFGKPQASAKRPQNVSVCLPQL